MSKYIDYINDPYFMKWIFQPDEATEQYWTDYLLKHPDEENDIKELKDQLSGLKLKNKVLDIREKQNLLRNILESKGKQIGQRSSKQLWTRLARYAAVALLFLLLGNLSTYIFLSESSQKIEISDNNSFDYSFRSDSPELWLADGEIIPLRKNSTIKYAGNKIITDDLQLAIPNENKAAYNQLVIPYGSKSRIILSDGTEINMNAGTKLIYPTSFNKSSREVRLLGEAYFKVSKNKHKPFIVKAGQLDIKVLGTRFNVTTYPESEKIETVLEEGSVSVSSKYNEQLSEPVILKPNQILTYNKWSKKVEVAQIDPEFYTLWKNGLLKFENADLNDIIVKVERIYDMKIILNDPQKGEMKISGKLNLSNNSKDLFDYLSAITQMNFDTINGKNYIMK